MSIENLELFRDGGSFSFSFKSIKYECNHALYILESNGKIIEDLNIILEIINSFDIKLKSDKEFNNLMKGRVNELCRFYKTLEKLKNQ